MDALQFKPQYMIFFIKASLITFFLMLQGAVASAAALVQPKGYPQVIRLNELIEFAQTMAGANSGSSEPLPAYAEALLADGRLSIGLGLGSEDLGAVRLPPAHERQTVIKKTRIGSRPVELEARFILSREDFRRALGDCEIVFVTSHSRYGAGPVFRNDGLARPFLMQKTTGYEIIMPDREVCGFSGKIKRQFYNSDQGAYYTVFEPDGSDLDSARPLHGYQMLVLSTCSSMQHFADEIKNFRSIYPTAAIFTRQAACLDTGMNVFIRLLSEIFQARELPDIVAALNQEYSAAAGRQLRKGSRAWKQTEAMYRLGINTLP